MARCRGPAATAIVPSVSNIVCPRRDVPSSRALDARRDLLFYTPAVASSSLQALLRRAAVALERGRGIEVAQMLAPQLRSSSLTRDEELAVRSMAAEAALLQDDLD